VGNETGIQWSVCPLKYEKKWAYAIELDDGTADTGQFAPRFFAQFQFADAPPGVGQGRRMPVVGSLALFPYCLEANPAILNFDQVREICSQGWAVANHSYAHKGRTWGDPPEVLTREQIREDLF